jgi:hypothetical protein
MNQNPYRPGAGHQPPFLAGRELEIKEFESLLSQNIILKNLIITGLRGMGKTVLLDALKPRAIKKDWLWTGNDISETATLTEENLALRILTDLSAITSGIEVNLPPEEKIGFTSGEDLEKNTRFLDYNYLAAIYNNTPGLVVDKLKKVFEFVWQVLDKLQIKGVVFAYDEAHLLSDQSKEKQYPLSLLLDLFQSVQKKKVPFLLVLTGLPTLMGRLVDSRTFSERLFEVIVLERLNQLQSRSAIVIPLNTADQNVIFDEQTIEFIINTSGGYPYFVQFLSREIYDIQLNPTEPKIPEKQVIEKLDQFFYAGRWNRATDREKDLLALAAATDLEDFALQDIKQVADNFEIKGFSSSQITQMLSRLIKKGLVFKNGRDQYSFALPMLADFIKRNVEMNAK